jgi:hypothetical protein
VLLHRPFALLQLQELPTLQQQVLYPTQCFPTPSAAANSKSDYVRKHFLQEPRIEQLHTMC